MSTREIQRIGDLVASLSTNMIGVLAKSGGTVGELAKNELIVRRIKAAS